MKIADFFAELKVKGDTLTMRDMVSRMGDMKLQTFGVITALSVLGTLLKDAAGQAMGMATGYTTLNKELGISSELLQRWQNVARTTNVPIDAVAQSFSNVQKILTGFRQGVQNEGFLKGASFLGIPNANFLSYDQFFEALRSRVPALLKARGQSYVSGALGMMGVDPAMVQMLGLGPAQFRAREYSAPIIGQGQVEQWTELNNEIIQLKNNIFQLLNDVLVPLLPVLISLTRGILGPVARTSSGLSHHESLIKQAGLGSYLHAALFANTKPGDTLDTLLAPKIARRAMASSVVVNQHNKTDVHVAGEGNEGLARTIRRHLDRERQADLTTAIQTLNTAQAY